MASKVVVSCTVAYKPVCGLNTLNSVLASLVENPSKWGLLASASAASTSLVYVRLLTVVGRCAKGVQGKREGGNGEGEQHAAAKWRDGKGSVWQ